MEPRLKGMGYSKQGGPRMGRNKPRHSEHNTKGSAQTPMAKTTDKSALLERLKKAAQQ